MYRLTAHHSTPLYHSPPPLYHSPPPLYHSPPPLAAHTQMHPDRIEYERRADGTIMYIREHYIENGQRVMDVEEFDESHTIVSYMCYFDDVIHRPDGPACIEWYPNGAYKSRRWCSHGVSHRDLGKPAHIEWYPNGTLRSARWYTYGNPGARGCPDFITWSADGSISGFDEGELDIDLEPDVYAENVYEIYREEFKPSQNTTLGNNWHIDA